MHLQHSPKTQWLPLSPHTTGQFFCHSLLHSFCIPFFCLFSLIVSYGTSVFVNFLFWQHWDLCHIFFPLLMLAHALFCLAMLDGNLSQLIYCSIGKFGTALWLALINAYRFTHQFYLFLDAHPTMKNLIFRSLQMQTLHVTLWGSPTTLITCDLNLPFLPTPGPWCNVSTVEQEEEAKAAGHRAEVGKEERSQETEPLEVSLNAFYE